MRRFLHSLKPCVVATKINPGQSKRINRAWRIPTDTGIRADPTFQPNRVTLEIAPGAVVVIAEVVVIQTRSIVISLAWMSQIKGERHADLLPVILIRYR